MPPKRKLPVRRRAKTGVRKSFRKSKRLNENTQYKFSRYYASKQEIVPGSGSIEQDSAYQFQFNLLQNYADFTSLFDSYKITKAVMYMRLMTNPNSNSINNPLNTAYLNIYPTLWYVVDNDDASVINLGQIKQHQGVKRRVMQPNKMIKITVYNPKVDMSLYDGITTAYQAAKSGWIDMTNADVPHYGIKYVVDFEAQAYTGIYHIQTETKLYFACKGVL